MNNIGKEIKAKKKFGQNFLKDQNVLIKIIESMPNTNNQLIEIGPGLGDLTKRLLVKRDVVAYEVDEELCVYLRNSFADEISNNRLILKCGDVLEKFASSEGLNKEPYDLVANLPYYIATTIILESLRDPLCKNIMVMVQKEVAQKFAAQTKDRNFGSLSVLTKSVGNASILFDVPPQAFEPIPKVDSSILMISKNSTLNDKLFEDFLRQCFIQPRKTLYKNLSIKFGKDNIQKYFEVLDLSLKLRPHETTTSQYHQLYKIINKGSLDGRDAREYKSK